MKFIVDVCEIKPPRLDPHKLKWSLIYILIYEKTTYRYSEHFKSIVVEYKSIGDRLPQLDGYQALFVQSPHLREVLISI